MRMRKGWRITWPDGTQWDGDCPQWAAQPLMPGARITPCASSAPHAGPAPPASTTPATDPTYGSGAHPHPGGCARCPHEPQQAGTTTTGSDRYMTNIGRAFATITLGLAALFTTLSPGATAAPHTSHPLLASVCATGYRGQPAYDRACLVTGTPRSAAHLWATIPTGTKGHEHDRADTQRDMCKYGHRHGGVAAWVRDTVGDLTYDRYRNNTTVDRWVAQDAVLTCAQLGYRR